MKKKSIKNLFLVFLFWWTIIFPQYNFLPQKSEEISNSEIHYFFYETIYQRIANSEK